MKPPCFYYVYTKRCSQKGISLKQNTKSFKRTAASAVAPKSSAEWPLHWWFTCNWPPSSGLKPLVAAEERLDHRLTPEPISKVQTALGAIGFFRARRRCSHGFDSNLLPVCGAPSRETRRIFGLTPTTRAYSEAAVALNNSHIYSEATHKKAS